MHLLARPIIHGLFLIPLVHTSVILTNEGLESTASPILDSTNRLHASFLPSWIFVIAGVASMLLARYISVFSRQTPQHHAWNVLMWFFSFVWCNIRIEGQADPVVLWA